MVHAMPMDPTPWPIPRIEICARTERTLAAFPSMGDDETIAIQRWQNPATGIVVYLPEGQDKPDTKESLERDGLILCQYDEHGKYISTIVHDPLNVRVLCWQLTVNADARRLGREPVFINLPAELVEKFPDSAE